MKVHLIAAWLPSCSSFMWLSLTEILMPGQNEKDEVLQTWENTKMTATTWGFPQVFLIFFSLFQQLDSFRKHAVWMVRWVNFPVLQKLSKSYIQPLTLFTFCHINADFNVFNWVCLTEQHNSALNSELFSNTLKIYSYPPEWILSQIILCLLGVIPLPAP